ncbi:hypothetical protein ASF72_02020 [Arthrobacter sp. Leaf141]|uniref:hypothetical protein n=1 Tax=Arthrobacter sp. Leaf141 TaxID=1736273 RepID=UPI000701AE86|nr:hypothetical protein [Arthrobacter sp. Leaf141]KQQ92485.1 hypothetical protein ASF72_02020 [Arthrobacter sp. Leaf141]
MSISQETITAIFDRAEVEPRRREDPELLGAAYAIAFINDAEEGPEARLYDSSVTLFSDEEGRYPYQASTSAMLEEVYIARMWRRSSDLEWAEIEALEAAADD